MDRKKAKIQNDISELQNKINDFNGKISALQSIREELLEKQSSGADFVRELKTQISEKASNIK